MADKWASRGAATLHGTMTSSFPNLFLNGTSHVGVGPNFTSTLEALSRHTAYIIKESLRRADDPSRAAVEPSVDAEEAWVAEVLKYDQFGSPLAVCTPGYYNSEGEARQSLSEEEQLKRRRNATYMRGVYAYKKVLSDWKDNGKFDGLFVRS